MVEIKIIIGLAVIIIGSILVTNSIINKVKAAQVKTFHSNTPKTSIVQLKKISDGNKEGQFPIIRLTYNKNGEIISRHITTHNLWNRWHFMDGDKMDEEWLNKCENQLRAFCHSGKSCYIVNDDQIDIVN